MENMQAEEDKVLENKKSIALVTGFGEQYPNWAHKKRMGQKIFNISWIFPF